MNVTKERLREIIREEVERFDEGPPAPGQSSHDPRYRSNAGDAKKALAQFTLKKVLQLAKQPLEDLVSKGDVVAKREFLTILATKLGIDIKGEVSKLGAMQQTQARAREAKG
jgi:hypothetical protein